MKKYISGQLHQIEKFYATPIWEKTNDQAPEVIRYLIPNEIVVYLCPYDKMERFLWVLTSDGYKGIMSNEFLVSV